MLVLYVRCAVAQALLGPRQLPAEVRRVVQLGHLKGGTIHNAQCSPAVFKKKGQTVSLPAPIMVTNRVSRPKLSICVSTWNPRLV